MQDTLIVPAPPRPGEERRAALLVIAVTVVALCLGGLLRAGVEGQSTSFSALSGALSLRYPQTWVTGKAAEGTLLTISDPRSTGSFNPTFTVSARALPQQGQRLLDVATSWMMGRMLALAEFHDLGSEQTTLAGRSAIRLNYAYIADPPAGSGPTTLPIVVRAQDTVVLVGNQVLVFSTAADAGDEEATARVQTILESVQFSGK